MTIALQTTSSSPARHLPYDIQLALVGRLDEENVDHGDYGDTPLAAKVRWIGKIDPLAD